jgi:hypothetical protein
MLLRSSAAARSPARPRVGLDDALTAALMLAVALVGSAMIEVSAASLVAGF